DQRVGIEEQLQQRLQQATHESHKAARRFVERRRFEGVRESGVSRPSLERWAGAAPQLLEQRGLDRAGIENGFEPPRREFLNLLRREVDAMTLRNPGADLSHDLLDVDMLARRLRLVLLRRITPVVAAPVRSPPSTMEMGPTAVLRVLICHYSML